MERIEILDVDYDEPWRGAEGVKEERKVRVVGEEGISARASKVPKHPGPALVAVVSLAYKGKEEKNSGTKNKA